MFEESLKLANVEMVMKWFENLGNGIVWKPVWAVLPSVSCLSFSWINSIERKGKQILETVPVKNEITFQAGITSQ